MFPASILDTAGERRFQSTSEGQLLAQQFRQTANGAAGEVAGRQSYARFALPDGAGDASAKGLRWATGHVVTGSAMSPHCTTTSLPIAWMSSIVSSSLSVGCERDVGRMGPQPAAAIFSARKNRRHAPRDGRRVVGAVSRCAGPRITRELPLIPGQLPHLVVVTHAAQAVLPGDVPNLGQGLVRAIGAEYPHPHTTKIDADEITDVKRLTGVETVLVWCGGAR